MPVSRDNNIWGRIRAQLKDAQDLILNGRYAEAMVQDRNLLKVLVGMQMDRACLVTSSLEGDIAQLFEQRVISRQARDNYSTIRILGDQAEAGQNNSAQDANTSFYLLKEALEEYLDKTTRNIGERMDSRERERMEREEVREAREIRQRQPQRRSGEQSRSAGQSRSSGQRSRSSGARRRREEPVSANIYDILKIVIPVVCVVLLIILIRTIWTGGKADVNQTTTAAVTTTAEVTTEATTEAVEEATTEAAKIYVTTSNVNLRSAPNTDAGTQIVRVIPSGTEIEVKGDYDDEWAIVDNNGTDAYVNKGYIQEKTE